MKIMDRFLVNIEDNSIKLYYYTVLEAWIANPKAKSITKYIDTEYLEFVSEIKKLSIETKLDYRGREIWKIPYNGSYILYRQYKDGEEYIDGCCYQRYDNLFGTMPVTWNCSEPEEFYNKFCKPHKELPIEIISINELKKLKIQSFWNKNNTRYYKDSDGYFYYVDKHDLPSKREVSLHKEHCGSKDAVLVKYGVFCSPKIKYEWFCSEKDFLNFWNKYEKEQNPVFGTHRYEIIKRGYSTTSPHDRKVVSRLPYFDLDSELKYNHGTECAVAWGRNLCNYSQFGDFDQNREFCLDLIKRYVDNVSREKR